MSWSWVMTHDGGPGGVQLAQQVHDHARRTRCPGRRSARRRAADRGRRPARGRWRRAASRRRTAGAAGGRAVAEPDPVQRRCGPRAALAQARPAVQQAVGDVVLGAAAGRRGGTAGRRSRCAGRAARRAGASDSRLTSYPADPDLARGGPVEGAEQVEQGGLAGAGRADDGDQFAARRPGGPRPAGRAPRPGTTWWPPAVRSRLGSLLGRSDLHALGQAGTADLDPAVGRQTGLDRHHAGLGALDQLQPVAALAQRDEPPRPEPSARPCGSR